MGIISDSFSIIFLNEQVATGLITFIFLVAFIKIIFVLYEMVKGV